MENTNPTSAEIIPMPSGPGRLLHQARQDLRLAPQDVAQILHLSPKQIIALEQDDYKNLPGPTYIRGYLRSYAQLLGLSPEKIIESYNSLTIPPQPLSLPPLAPPPQITSGDRLVKTATVAVAAIVLGLVYLWWRSEGEAPEKTISPPSIANRAPAEGPASQPGASEGVSISPTGSTNGIVTNPPALSPVTEPAPQATSNAAPTRGVAPSPAPSPVVKPVPANGQVTVSGMILNVAPAESPKAANPAVPAHTDRAVTRTRRAADIPPGVPRSRLVLHAVQESWADVRDAGDNKLLYENIPAGRSIAIEGVAPFSVFLGNADGVRVEFNGQNFDIGRYKRGPVARFTLGENPAVKN